MKKFSRLPLIVILSALLFPHPVFAEGEVGRYQLFQAKYNHWDSVQNASSENSELFLLDTSTGEAKIYVSTTVMGGKQVKYWTPAIVDESKLPQ